MSLINKLRYSINMIYLSLCIFDRYKQVEKNEEKKVLLRELCRIEPNPKWSLFRKFCRQFAALFVWPILTPLFTLFIEIPIIIIHHVAMLAVDVITSVSATIRASVNDPACAKEMFSSIDIPATMTYGSNVISSMYNKLPENPFTYAYKKFSADTSNTQSGNLPQADVPGSSSRAAAYKCVIS